jgi:xanthine dehydrogenase accessory factor
MPDAVFKSIVRAIEDGEPAALITIISTNGSTPQRVGAKILVYEDGRTVGTIGGGCYESDACLKAREVMRTRKARVVHYDLTDALAEENGLICGGQMDVFIDPLEASPDLFVIGAGHVGREVACLAHGVGFRVHVLDDREKFAHRDRFPEPIDLIVDNVGSWLQQADIKPTAYVVVVTRGHKNDLTALEALAEKPFRYLGMIGSRAKVARIADALVAGGIGKDWVAGMHAPIGLKIGAVTPEEIAVSIVAELIAVRRGADTQGGAPGEPMRWSKIGA